MNATETPPQCRTNSQCFAQTRNISGISLLSRRYIRTLRRDYAAIKPYRPCRDTTAKTLQRRHVAMSSDEQLQKASRKQPFKFETFRTLAIRLRRRLTSTPRYAALPLTLRKHHHKGLTTQKYTGDCGILNRNSS